VFVFVSTLSYVLFLISPRGVTLIESPRQNRHNIDLRVFHRDVDMPYKSEAQRRYFNANREKLEAEGVDVDEWNESSKGKKLPEKAEKKANFDVNEVLSTVLTGESQEERERREKEKQMLDKAVARNVRERVARRIAAEKFASASTPTEFAVMLAQLEKSGNLKGKVLQGLGNFGKKLLPWTPSALGGAAGGYEAHNLSGGDPTTTALGAVGGASILSPTFWRATKARGLKNYADEISKGTLTPRDAITQQAIKNYTIGAGVKGGLTAAPTLIQSGKSTAEDIAGTMKNLEQSTGAFNQRMINIRGKDGNVIDTVTESEFKELEDRPGFMPGRQKKPTAGKGKGTAASKPSAPTIENPLPPWAQHGVSAELARGGTAAGQVALGLANTATSAQQAAGSVSDASKQVAKEVVPGIAKATKDVGGAAKAVQGLTEEGRKTRELVEGALGDIKGSGTGKAIQQTGDLAETLSNTLTSAGESFESFKNAITRNAKTAGLAGLGAVGLYALYRVFKNRKEEEEKEKRDKRDLRLLRMAKAGSAESPVIKSLVLEKLAGKRGLWDNIHAKRKRGEKPAKPGDKDYPDSKSWKKTTKEANIKGRMAAKLVTNASKLLPGAGKKVIPKPSQWQEFLTVYNDPRKLDAFISKNLPNRWPFQGKNDPRKLDAFISKNLPNRWPFQGKQGSDNSAIKALVLEKIAKGRCWDGYEPVPGKDAYSDDSCRKVGSKKKKKGSKKEAALKDLVLEKLAKSPAWQREEGKSESGGLNAKGRASLKAKGQDIKAPVTQKNPKGKAKGRKASFCARMGGMKKKLTSEKTRNDPDSRINKSLRKWNC
jgi:hypothetical protein